jgi:hypothetical protein
MHLDGPGGGIQEGRLAAVDTPEDGDLEAQVLKPADQPLHCRPEFHELPPRENLPQLGERPGSHDHRIKPIQASLQVAPGPLAKIRAQLVNQPPEVFTSLGAMG